EELRQFAGKAYWLIQFRRQVVYDKTRRRALYNTPTTFRSSGTSDSLFNSSQKELIFPSTYSAGVSLPETQPRRKHLAADPSASNAYYVPYGVDSNLHVDPNPSMGHVSPMLSDLPNSSEFLGLSLGGSWQGSVHGIVVKEVMMVLIRKLCQKVSFFPQTSKTG
ncbi:hypothetical protein MKX03_024770, partial [Papaver bracteatum]